MKIFVAASYSSQVNYDTGEVFLEYREWLENILDMIEQQNHTVFCSLRADQYKINTHNPSEALAYFNAAMVRAKVADEVELPLTGEKLKTLLSLSGSTRTS